VGTSIPDQNPLPTPVSRPPANFDTLTAFSCNNPAPAQPPLKMSPPLSLPLWPKTAPLWQSLGPPTSWSSNCKLRCLLCLAFPLLQLSLWQAPPCPPKTSFATCNRRLPPFLLLEFSSPWQLGPLRPLPWSSHPRAPCQRTRAVGSNPTQPELPPPPAAPAPSLGTSWTSSTPPTSSQEVPGSLAATSHLPPTQRAAQGPRGTPTYRQLPLSFSGPSSLPPFHLLCL